jgi:hypothetical protein
MKKMKQAKNSRNETVVMKECGDSYIVTVSKEQLPPHYSKLHETRQSAEKDYRRLVQQ